MYTCFRQAYATLTGSERHPQGQNTESNEDKIFRIKIIQQIKATTLRNHIINDVKRNGRINKVILYR